MIPRYNPEWYCQLPETLAKDILLDPNSTLYELKDMSMMDIDIFPFVSFEYSKIVFRKAKLEILHLSSLKFDHNENIPNWVCMDLTYKVLCSAFYESGVTENSRFTRLHRRTGPALIYNQKPKSTFWFLNGINRTDIEKFILDNDMDPYSLTPDNLMVLKLAFSELNNV